MCDSAPHGEERLVQLRQFAAEARQLKQEIAENHDEENLIPKK